MAMRAVDRAFLKVGALRTLEIVLAQLPGAVDLATTPFLAIPGCNCYVIKPYSPRALQGA
jgi:hypothetical protein